MFTTPYNILWIALAGLGTGVLGAVLGTGGGVFLIPLLVLGLGVPMHYAVATSIVAVIATSSAVACTNVERGTANMRLGMTLEIATALGAVAGGLAAASMSARVLECLFAMVLLPTAAVMWKRKAIAETSAAETLPPSLVAGCSAPASPPLGTLDGAYDDPAEGGTIVYRVRRLWAGLGISFLAGGVSGLLGIGGGVFKVPALHLLCDVPIKAAAATSNFMIGVTAAASAFLYYGRGEIRPALTATAVLGVLAGSALGSLLNQKIRGADVRRLFAVLLGLVAAHMLYRAVFAGG